MDGAPKRYRRRRRNGSMTMKIKTIISQNRRDFRAVYECEWCGHTYESYGYDDANFHQNVIPNKTCPECGKGAHPTYRPLTTQYPEGFQI